MSGTSKENASSPKTPEAHKDDAGNRRDNADGTENVVFLHPIPTEPSPTAQYLDRSVDIEALPIPIVRFPRLVGVVPEQESVCIGRTALLKEIAPEPAPVVERKDQVRYYIAGTLKEAELKNQKLREKRLKKGQSTVGKQRSGAHIDTLGPALLLDDDGDVFSREPALRALGAAAVIYSSYSFGFVKEGATELSRGGRVALFLNRVVSVLEYGPIWDAINHLLGGGFDEHGRSSSLCYGRHARRSDQAPFQRLVIDGAALDANALLEFGKSLRPARSGGVPKQPGNAVRKKALVEELERAKLMGAIRPPDDYGEWIAGAAAFKRGLGGNAEAAFQCFDAWSACSTKYAGSRVARDKFDEMTPDYEGTAAPLTLAMLHWRARRRAEAVIRALYSRVPKAASPEEEAPENTDPATIWPKGAEPIPPNTLSAGDGIVALEYLLHCWSESACQSILAAHQIPEDALEEAKRRNDQRREKVELAGRILHLWDGKDLATDTAALADAIVAAGPPIYRIDSTLVRISAPVTDAATATRSRKLHNYKGRPGELGDPALHAGERLVPILPSDTEALRDIISEHVATKRKINDGTKKNPIWREEIASFSFKPGTALHVGPDAGVLKDLCKRVLVAKVPEIVGVITAPVMPDLPSSTKPDDLSKAAADRLITGEGFDADSGLYLSPVGTVVEVSESPSEAEVEAAANLLQEPWTDFPFVSPGGDIQPDVSLSAAIYSMFIAANRRALDIAPGIAFSSHGEGMSSGKTLAGEVICTVATGDIPTPISLSPDFSEQRKEIISHLVEGDGCLFMDNVANGTRFDSAPLAIAMTNPRFKARLLGANKQIEASTRTMPVATGNALNLAGDLASRFLLARIDTGLERPEDRSVTGYRIPDLRRWTVEHRQQLVAAVHTIVRGYLQECRARGGTPWHVADRREVSGTRFGGRCDVLRDAFLWAFPNLLDPFLSFKASAANSSTKVEAALVLAVLDKLMAASAGRTSAPVWATISASSAERQRWEANFRARWKRMTPDERDRRYRTTSLGEAEMGTWQRLQHQIQVRAGRRELRAGRARFTSLEISNAIRATQDEQAIVEGAMHGKGLNPVSLGRWLKDHLVDAPINGQVLRSATDRKKLACFWIETF
jgi:Primase C terminal 2 (PriCT-2)